MIDLHLHTTASDGLTTPFELVGQAAAAGLTVMAVTDHDTTAAVAETRAFGRDHGIEVVSGIEITAVEPHGLVVNAIPGEAQDIGEQTLG